MNKGHRPDPEFNIPDDPLEFGIRVFPSLQAKKADHNGKVVFNPVMDLLQHDRFGLCIPEFKIFNFFLFGPVPGYHHDLFNLVIAKHGDLSYLHKDLLRPEFKTHFPKRYPACFEYVPNVVNLFILNERE